MHDPYEGMLELGWAILLCAAWWVLAVVGIVLGA
jgi:hypothetical protein